MNDKEIIEHLNKCIQEQRKLIEMLYKKLGL